MAAPDAVSSTKIPDCPIYLFKGGDKGAQDPSFVEGDNPE
ncbi:hypothetical protein CALK_2421 [Chitinivibrio alkaliphilus ACht1]|uniref:Uncharacterized protein n=1 Tax=Chitinivibrio alkaliphilus ACht1 TaxID=1313304 RepID=U7D2L8_9BACT|nr:hypothetical protein CALK_2421 [Chitinivibrio alkaliphilus ACht1]